MNPGSVAIKIKQIHFYSSSQLLRNPSASAGLARTPGLERGRRSGRLEPWRSSATDGPRGLGHVHPAPPGPSILISKCENRPDGLRSL